MGFLHSTCTVVVLLVNPHRGHRGNNSQGLEPVQRGFKMRRVSAAIRWQHARTLLSLHACGVHSDFPISRQNL